MDYRFFNVVDVECTCWEGSYVGPQNEPQEIIEIGIAEIDVITRKVYSSSSILIKPQYSQVNSFCTSITGYDPDFIMQNGISYELACNILQKKYNSRSRSWGSWGNFDLNMFEKNSKLHDVTFPFSNFHFNIKALFALKYGLKIRLSVEKALSYIGNEFIGSPHRGCDDALNTALIFSDIMWRH